MSSSQMSDLADDVAAGTDAVVATKKERCLSRAKVEACEASRIEAAFAFEATAARDRDPLLLLRVRLWPPYATLSDDQQGKRQEALLRVPPLLRFHEIDRGELEQDA